MCSSTGLCLWDEACIGTQRTCPRPAAKTCWPLQGFDQIWPSGHSARPSLIAICPRPAGEASPPAHSLRDLDARMVATIQRANAAHLEPSKSRTPSRSSRFASACHIEHQHTARPVPEAQDDFYLGSEQHGGVIGYQAGPKQQQDPPDRRFLPVPACGSSWSTSRPANASEQHEVDGHEPAPPEVSQAT